MRIDWRPVLLVIALTALAALAVRDFMRLGDGLPWRTMDEFADFYCAGRSLDEGKSPYLYEPLRRCEHMVASGTSFRAQMFSRNTALAVPAPQPAYDFLPFMALGRLPAEAARVTYAVAILVAIASITFLLIRLGVPPDLAVAGFAIPTAYVELSAAQIVPFALCALVVCGWSLARGRDALAGCAAALTMIEPSLGVGVVAVTLAYVPRARYAAIAVLAALIAVMLAVVGTHGLWEYLVRLLPSHAAAEITFPFQYSLTYLLRQLGASPSIALRAGTASYLLLLATALWLSPRLSATLRRPELLAFIPALCATIAGPFLHQEELAFALPALLVLARTASRRAAPYAATSLCLVAVPWIPLWGMKQLFLGAIVVCAIITVRLCKLRWASAAITAAIALTIYLFELHPPHLPAPSDISTPRKSAVLSLQEEWSDYVAARSTRDPFWVLIKIPSWIGLGLALTLALALVLRSPPSSAASLENSHERPSRAPGLPRARTG